MIKSQFRLSLLFTYLLYFFCFSLFSITSNLNTIFLPFQIKIFIMAKLILMLLYLTTSSTAIIPLPRANIVHPTSGLALQYVAQYSPADSIIPLTVSIPLTGDMCYVLPLHVLKKIPSCRDAQITKNKRSRRFLPEIIAIGMGTAALTMATTNSFQITQLKHDMESIVKSLTEQDDHTTTQLLHLHEGQLKMALVLNHTQMALNQTINIMNYHNIQMEHLEIYAKYLDNKLTTFIHSVESHFLHTSLSDIFANRLNLQFIHHRDLNTVIQFVMTSTNITFNNATSDSILINLVNNLLIQQTVHFLPNITNSTLGILSITSFFAAKKHPQPSFNIYRLIPIPFSHSGLRVRIANMPTAIGIDFEQTKLITWNSMEVSTCNFQAISTCRETPPIITSWHDTCLYQVLTDSVLSACRIEIYTEPLFFHEMGKQWLISTNATQTCHFSVFSKTDPPSLIKNTVRTLPPVTLITLPEKTTLICERFSIQATPEVTGPPLFIWNLDLQVVPREDTINLSHYLTNSTRWPKIPYIPDEFRAMFNFLKNTSNTTHNYQFRNIHRHPFGIFSIVIIIIVIIIITLMIYLVVRRPRLPSIYIPISTADACSPTTTTT